MARLSLGSSSLPSARRTLALGYAHTPLLRDENLIRIQDLIIDWSLFRPKARLLREELGYNNPYVNSG